MRVASPARLVTVPAGTCPAPNAATTRPCTCSASALMSAPSSPSAIIARPTRTFRRGTGAEQWRPVAEPHRDIDLTLGDVIERPEARRGERHRAGGVRLGHPPGGMDLVVHDDHAAQSPCGVARRDLDRR